MEVSLLSCPVCLKPHFQGVDALRTSLISVATTNISCPVCNELFLGLDKLTIHLFSHISNKITQDSQSQMDTSSEIEVEHYNNKSVIQESNNFDESSMKSTSITEDIEMPSTEEKKNSMTTNDSDNVVCDICNFHFSDETILDLHQKLLHQTSPDTETGKYNYHCHLCSKQFKMRGSLMVHLRVAHFGFVQSNHRNKKVLGTSKSNNNNKIDLQEELLEQADQSMPNVFHDEQQSTIEQNKMVAISSQQQNQVPSVQLEKRKVLNGFSTSKSQDNKQWECEICLKLFTTKYFLKKHKRLHTDFQTRDEAPSSALLNTPRKRQRSNKQYTPRTKKKLDQFKVDRNKIKCKLFRRRKTAACFCAGNTKTTSITSRARVCRLITESKQFMSKDAHVLFANELRSAFVSKYNRRYTDDMKQLCLSWYYSSPRGYRNAALALHLTTPRSIRNWQSLLQIQSGINNVVLTSIRGHMNRSKNSHEILASLLFDEISLKEEIHYNATKDKIVGIVDDRESRTNEKAKTALVCMITGITHSWKHVLGYWLFGAKHSSEQMKNIVLKCIDAAIQGGLIVKSIICDQGPLNQGLAKELQISKMQPFFSHHGNKIYFIYDVPHLIKSVRNNLRKYDLKWEGKIVSWRHIQTAVNSAHPVRVRLLPKIGSQHLNINNFSAMKVKYATQIFSEAMSVALLVMRHLEIVGADSEATCTFVKDMDTIFDCLNSNQLKPNKIKMRYAICEHSTHVKIMNDINSKFENAVFIGARRPPCLTGWQVTINSVLLLAKELREDFGVSGLLTRHLNQDPLENVFSIVRQQHGCCKNPSTQQFENGLRHTYITSISKLSSNSNCENDYNVMLTTLRSMSNIQEPVKTMPSLTTCSTDLIHIADLNNSLSVLDENAIYYVSGYFCRKFLKLHNCDICRTIILDKEKHYVGEHQLFTYFRQSDVLDYVNEGLLFPSNAIYEFLKTVEMIHNEHFNSLLKSNCLTLDFIHIIRSIPNVPVITLCCANTFDFFLATFLKMRHHWGARLDLKNQNGKVHNSNNQKLKNLCHV